MGNCRSCEATAVATGASAAAAAATVKLVRQDGEMLEFERPVRASHVVQKEPGCFVCNADDMEFDGLLSAVNADEDLQPGQIYFLLPLSMLRRPLHAEEMAALAVRASAALMKCRCRRRSVAPLVFPDRPKAELPAGCSGGGRRVAEERKRRRSGGSSRSFTSNLSAILETAE